jgi:membrane protease YdiL (CAAX protease family)
MTNKSADHALDAPLAMAFAPIHKLALGIASGLVFGLLMVALTLLAVVLDGGDGERSLYLGLLNNYFYGYSVSPAGALIGLFWGFVVGFVAGFFAAFVRNLAVSIAVFALRTKAELSQTTDFLDHI